MCFLELPLLRGNASVSTSGVALHISVETLSHSSAIAWLSSSTSLCLLKLQCKAGKWRTKAPNSFQIKALCRPRFDKQIASWFDPQIDQVPGYDHVGHSKIVRFNILSTFLSLEVKPQYWTNFWKVSYPLQEIKSTYVDKVLLNISIF